MNPSKAPVNDSTILAVARLVDEAQSGTREPSCRRLKNGRR